MAGVIRSGVPREGHQPSATLQVRQIANERRAKIAELRLAGVRNQGALAAQFGVAQATISRDFAVLDDMYRERAIQDIQAAKGLDLERIDSLITGLWPRARAGNLGAVDRVLALLTRRAKMMGYDAPDQVEHHGDPVIRVTILDGHGDTNLDPLSLAAAWGGGHVISADGPGNRALGPGRDWEDEGLP